MGTQVPAGNRYLGVGSKVSGKSAIFSPLKIALPLPPLSIFSPDFHEMLDVNDKTRFEMLGEGEEGY